MSAIEDNRAAHAAFSNRACAAIRSAGVRAAVTAAVKESNMHSILHLPAPVRHLHPPPCG